MKNLLKELLSGLTLLLTIESGSVKSVKAKAWIFAQGRGSLTQDFVSWEGILTLKQGKMSNLPAGPPTLGLNNDWCITKYGVE